MLRTGRVELRKHNATYRILSASKIRYGTSLFSELLISSYRSNYIVPFVRLLLGTLEP